MIDYSTFWTPNRSSEPEGDGFREYRALGPRATDRLTPTTRSRKAATAAVYVPAPTLATTNKGVALNKEEEEQGREPRLFFTRPATITHLRADPDMTASAVTLLGMAINDYPDIQGDDVLSEYSSPIVKRGLEAGVLQPNPGNPGADVNYSTHKSAYYLIGDYLDHAVPDYKVQAARQTVRNILRPKPRGVEEPPVTQHLSDQFHPQLPGLEG